MLRGLGWMTGARRGGALLRAPVATPARGPSGDKGEEPLLVRCSVGSRCCCKLEASDTRDVFWLSYGDEGLLMFRLFMRLSTLLRRESRYEDAASVDAVLFLLSKPWLIDGNALCCIVSARLQGRDQQVQRRTGGYLPDDGVTGSESRDGVSSAFKIVCS